MIAVFKDLDPVLQALLAACFTWGVTALGASIVFFTRTVNRKLLDSMMGFAAGAMVFVVIEELIPESQSGSNTDLATTSAMAGFVVMMLLDVALG